jgi:hypothetical protein
VILTFAAGGVLRTVQQLTGSARPDAYIPALAILLMLLMLFPLPYLIYGRTHNPYKAAGSLFLVAFLAATPFLACFVLARIAASVP